MSMAAKDLHDIRTALAAPPDRLPVTRLQRRTTVVIGVALFLGNEPFLTGIPSTTRTEKIRLDDAETALTTGSTGILLGATKFDRTAAGRTFLLGFLFSHTFPVGPAGSVRTHLLTSMPPALTIGPRGTGRQLKAVSGR